MERSTRAAFAAAAALVALSGLTGTSSARTPAPSAIQGGAAPSGWQVIPSANAGSFANGLAGVAALSKTDIWAVGSHQSANAPPTNRTLIEHWGGAKWSVVQSPNVGTNENDLKAVGAVSAGDVWAVGNYFDNGSLAWRTLAEHWDGSRWTVIPSPSPSTRFNSLQGVAAVGANDVWAVGIQQTSGPTIANKTLVEHWDGSAWSTVPSPNAGSGDNYLLAVAAVSSDDVWAVGHHDTHTLAEHWDGSTWSIVSSPSPGGQANTLDGVTAVSANDVWAAGSEFPGGGNAERTLTEHWDGTSWRVVPSPNAGSGNNALFAVAASTNGDVWAVGDFFDPPFDNRTLTERWDGTSWSVVPSPSPGNEGILSGVTGVTGGIVVSVGGFEQGAERTLVLAIKGG
jgi:hypothetical protein